MQIGFSKLKLIPVAAMRRVAQWHIGEFRLRVNRGISASGKKFKKYTKSYEKKKLKLGRSISPPNFELTSNTLNRMQADSHNLTPGEHFYKIVFKQQGADIVSGNAERGRDIISDIPRKEKQMVAERMQAEVEKELKQKIKKRIRIKV